MNESLLKYKSVLALFFLFMFFGNSLRLIPMASAIGSINPLEVILHLYCLIILTVSMKEFRLFPKLLLLCYSFFVISYLFGSLRVHHLNFVAFTYNIRILLFFITSFAIGLSFKKIFSNNLKQVLDFFLFVFLANVAVAWMIYFIFPESAQLWSFLSLFGIIFNGDPHIHRLLGTLFDPNFFGNLLVLPILFSLYLFEKTNQKKYLLFFIILLLSELFTFSRSSVLGLSIGIFIYYLADIKMILLNQKIKFSLLFSTLALVGVFSALIYFFPEEIERLTERISSITDDDSAKFRLEDFMLAFNLLSQVDVLLFGIGFNFFTFFELTSSSSIDSSILSLLVTLGLPLFILVAISISLWFKNSRPETEEGRDFYNRTFINYLIVSMVICNFNNLLLYPFWFFTFFSIVFYLQLTEREEF